MITSNAVLWFVYLIVFFFNCLVASEILAKLFQLLIKGGVSLFNRFSGRKPPSPGEQYETGTMLAGHGLSLTGPAITAAFILAIPLTFAEVWLFKAIF